MTRYTAKAELLQDIRAQRSRLEKELAALTPEEKTRPGVVGTWSVKDVMAHLADWEQRFADWYQTGKRGETPSTPAPGVSGYRARLDDLNAQTYERYKGCSFGEIQALFDASHRQIVDLLDGMSEEELFTAGFYTWTGQEVLAGWAAANTSNHYLWARTQIRARWHAGRC
jgi:hypothetical protein